MKKRVSLKYSSIEKERGNGTHFSQESLYHIQLCTHLILQLDIIAIYQCRHKHKQLGSSKIASNATPGPIGKDVKTLLQLLAAYLE